ncbi:MAG: hypothetical protein Q4G68_14245 [Planctomycetia bacterium]|nr:hypothetical protein [Planctomycetia bacterium]
MAVTETGVSYYGLSYIEHAEADFREMLDHHCNAVVLALSEFDLDFWFPNIVAIAKRAKDMGLTVYLDTWGIGKWFGGEPTSLFLTNNPGNRQESAFTGELLPAACFNTVAFREYFWGLCEKLAAEVEADGFFWDEPHYALPKSYASITGGAGDDWTCRCTACQRKFQERYGYEMPRQLTMEVKRFRQVEALDILETASRKIKAIRPSSKIINCVHATLGTYYVTENRGYDNWDRVAGSEACDVFSTTILSYSLPRSFFRSITERTVAVAQRHGKGNQRWLMGYYQEPENLHDIIDVARLYADLGVESLFAWTYRGGYGTVLAAPRALEVWDTIGQAYGEVRGL